MWLKCLYFSWNIFLKTQKYKVCLLKKLEERNIYDKVVSQFILQGEQESQNKKCFLHLLTHGEILLICGILSICFDIDDGPIIIVTFIGKAGALGCLIDHIKSDSILSVISYPDLPYIGILDPPGESLRYARAIYGDIPILTNFSQAPCISKHEGFFTAGKVMNVERFARKII